MIAGRGRRHTKTTIADVIPTHRARHPQPAQCIPRRRRKRTGPNTMTVYFWSVAAELPGISDGTVCRCQAVACQVDSELHSRAIAGAERGPDLSGSTNSVRRNGASPSIRHAGREQNRSNRSVITRICVHTNESCTVRAGTLKDKRRREAVPVRIVEPVAGSENVGSNRTVGSGDAPGSSRRRRLADPVHRQTDAPTCPSTDAPPTSSRAAECCEKPRVRRAAAETSTPVRPKRRPIDPSAR